jgi:hypothetical protein
MRAHSVCSVDIYCHRGREATDGPAEITQKPIEPGETFTYEFTATTRNLFLSSPC